jgi:hypothetical protein
MVQFRIGGNGSGSKVDKWVANVVFLGVAVLIYALAAYIIDLTIHIN